MQPVVLENKVTPEQLAASAARLYARVLTGSEQPDVLPNAGWRQVALVACELYLATEEKAEDYTVKDLAGIFLKNYRRATDADDQDTPLDQLKALERVAWETIARHLVFCCQLDEEADTIAGSEAYRADLADRQLEREQISR